MRPLHWARLDKRRPLLVLTREIMVGQLSIVTVAPITSTVHGIATEFNVGPANGLGQPRAVTCDRITSIPIDRLREQCRWLLEDQERALHEAIQAAIDLV